MADQGRGQRQGGMQSGRSQDWQQGSRGEWTGPERRVGINYNYTGPERRKSEMEDKPRVPQGEYGQTGGMGMRPNTTERGHYGSGGTGGSMSGGTSGSSTGGGVGGGTAESDRGGRVGPERPYDEDIEDQ